MNTALSAISLDTFSTWAWDQIAPYYADLEAQPLTEANVIGWLATRNRLSQLLDERYQRLYIATSVNTADEAAQAAFEAYISQIQEPKHVADQRLIEKLLATGLVPEGYEVPLAGLRAHADVFSEANVPLFTQDETMCKEYDKLDGAATIQWQGEELTPAQLLPMLQDDDPAVRERAWRARIDRRLADRAALNDLWVRLLRLRLQVAANAGLPDYRAYMWKKLQRLDYTPADCEAFQQAIEAVVVPAAAAIYEKRRARLGTPTLRPWDLTVDTLGRPALRPFSSGEELARTGSAIFHQVDPQLGAYFDDMRANNLLDLENRKGKAGGGYCSDLPVSERAFIFQNSVGMHDDLQTLLHEGGHAFHCYEYGALPLYKRVYAQTEFAEVASMGMELLASPYLSREFGGFYSPEDAARARVEHLESMITFWPYMAVVDAFQHWVYTHPNDALDPANCDAQWAALWDRFMVGIDYSGLGDAHVTGWHRKLHIFQIPFYYVEYGIAQVGAAQVWMNAKRNQAEAVAAYRRALALGGTRNLPDLFAAAGVRFGMDEATLRPVVGALMDEIAALETD